MVDRAGSELTSGIDYFVVLAGMRTGSNLLEEQLKAMPGLVSHGELFNPHFFGKPETKSMWGLSMVARDSDPEQVIRAMRNVSTGLPGFRLFYDHDQRAIDHVLADRRAAKIILTRRPIDSYVSLKIARKTGQWWLGDMTSARAAKVPFDAEEYAEFLCDLSEFQRRIARSLQTTGQTAFQISYDDLSDQDVLAGLGEYLGSDGPPNQEMVRAKVQNPTPVSARLTNPSVADEALQNLMTPDLGRLPSFEPDRGPGLRFFRVCRTAPLLYMPIRGAGFDPVPGWMKAVDPEGEIDGGMTQKDLRRWKRQHPGHRSFTVMRHPLPRAYDSFCRFILPVDVESYADIRDGLSSQYGVPLPGEWPASNWDLTWHSKAFLAFLKFLTGNLGGQTALRVDSTWATQATLLFAIGQFAIPDRVVRSDALAEEMLELCRDIGVDAPAMKGSFAVEAPFPLSDVVTKEISDACEAAYRRDFVMFGFETWKSGS